MNNIRKWLVTAAALATSFALADTILLVNNNYTDGETTSLGYTGYSSFAAARMI